MAHKSALGDGEDIVQLLKGSLLRLRDEQEDHHKRDDVEASVQSEGAGRCERGKHARESDRKDSSPEETGRNGPRHANLAVGQGEDFG